MGSVCELVLSAPSRDELERVLALSVAEVMRLERKYSRYRDDSVTAEINAAAGTGRSVAVDPETASLLEYAETAWRESGGLFDITSGVLRRAWDFRSGRLPEPEAVRALLSRVGWRHVEWRRPRIGLPREGMELDFGGYVKEYAVDRVAELCRREGLRHGLVNLGGDVAVVGPRCDGSAWQVGITHPREPGRSLGTLPLLRGALASSGDYERFMLVDGVRYGHVLDPRTGWPVRGLAGVSVAGPHCLVAGTATTVALLRGRRGARWLRELGLPHLWLDAHGEVGGSLAPPLERRGTLAAAQK